MNEFQEKLVEAVYEKQSVLNEWERKFISSIWRKKQLPMFFDKLDEAGQFALTEPQNRTLTRMANTIANKKV